jgi:mono/diheme cytochrome c family protein
MQNLSRRALMTRLVACALSALLLSALVRSTSVAQVPPGDAQSLSNDARHILETRCFECHGQNTRGRTADFGGFGSVLDTATLIERDEITPGSPDHSNLFVRVRDGQMPPQGPLSPEEVQTLGRWITSLRNAGSAQPQPTRQLVTREQVITAVRQDLTDLPEVDRPFMRYLSLHTVANQRIGSARCDDELESARLALRLLLNSLSWQRRPFLPETLLDGTLVRVDLRRIGWTETSWNALLARYPYGVQVRDSGSPSICSLQSGNTEAICGDTPFVPPWVRADWFLYEASRAPLYDTLLELPARAEELERRLGVDALHDRSNFTARRSGFVQSGVSQNNRVIERHETPYGAYWRSFDFADSAGTHNVFQHPLGPGESDGFTPSGGEAIFNLPNGLQGYMLFDGAGRRLAEAPTAIVQDRTSRDAVVRNGISCLSCHGLDGIKRKTDEVAAAARRSNTLAPLLPTVEGLYGRGDFEALVRDDMRRYSEALQVLDRTQRLQGQTALPITTFATQYRERLTRDAVAVELGTSPDQLAREIQRSTGVLRDVLGPMLNEGQTIPRDAFECAFRSIITEFDPSATFFPATVARSANCGDETATTSRASAQTYAPQPATVSNCPPRRTQLRAFDVTGNGQALDRTQACGAARQNAANRIAQQCATDGTTPGPTEGLACSCGSTGVYFNPSWTCTARGNVGCFRSDTRCE